MDGRTQTQREQLLLSAAERSPSTVKKFAQARQIAEDFLDTRVGLFASQDSDKHILEHSQIG